MVQSLAAWTKLSVKMTAEPAGQQYSSITARILASQGEPLIFGR